MSCHGNFSLNEETRRTWYNPEQILKEAELKNNTCFMDIGCADGFFTLLAAKTIGPEGTVYAIDIDPTAIKQLTEKAKQQNLQNIKTKVAPAEQTILCSNCADIVFFSMVLHDFKDPKQVLANAKKMLKPTGKLINLDWKKQQMQFGPPTQIRFSQQDATKLLEAAGFEIDKTKDAGPYHYLITAKPKNK